MLCPHCQKNTFYLAGITELETGLLINLKCEQCGHRQTNKHSRPLTAIEKDCYRRVMLKEADERDGKSERIFVSGEDLPMIVPVKTK